MSTLGERMALVTAPSALSLLSVQDDVPVAGGTSRAPPLAQGRTRPDEGAGVAAFFPGQAGFIVGRKTNEL